MPKEYSTSTLEVLYLITGIGRAITLALVNRGCEVLAIGRSLENLEALRADTVS